MLPAAGPLAVTVDSQIEGVHFVPDLDPALVARRLLAVNLSDLAAMGADPGWAFLALSAPPAFDHDRFLRSFSEACRAHGVTLAGGDLARCDRLVATATLIGTKPDERHWLRRDAARPGQSLWLGGTVGESAMGRLLIDRGARPGRGAGLRLVRLPADLPSSLSNAARRAVRRHVSPVPQIDLGRWLGSHSGIAGMDVSDGVARDLHRLCRESGVGAEIDAESLPFSERYFDLCKILSVDPVELALTGGEDYVLLFTLPDGEAPPDSFGCRQIGSIRKRSGVSWVHGGKRRKLAASGWDHLVDPPSEP